MTNDGERMARNLLPRIGRRNLLKTAVSAGAAAGFSGMLGRIGEGLAQSAGGRLFAGRVNTGPSSRPVPAIGATAGVPGTPYLVPTAPGWSSTSLLTVGNDINGYRLVGIPDGLGAYDNGDRTITLLVAHEIKADAGIARAHGGKGAFVSRWVMNKDTLEVLSGRDLVTGPAKLNLWRDGSWRTADQTPGPGLSLSRLCSADLAPVSAFYSAATGKGYDGRLLLCGEESGNDNANRAFAFVPADGSAYELPDFSFGKAGDKADPPPSWENLLANPRTGERSVVIAISDGGTYQVYVYLGVKQASGSPAEKAGLTGGRLLSIKVEGVDTESRDSNIGLAKSLVGKGAGKRFGLSAVNKGTSFLRPEDGAWDPRNRNVFYFVTTDRNNFAADGTARAGQDVSQIGRSRLWTITFDNVEAIAADGNSTGKIEMLLDGTEGGDMFDNITIDRNGVIYLCEDPGNSRHVAKVWAYDTTTGAFTAIMRTDPAKFGDIVEKAYTPPAAPFVDDKESSGIIDVTDLFASAAWFQPGSTVLIADVQAHFGYDAKDAIGAELVEGGQLLLLVKSPA